MESGHDGVEMIYKGVFARAKEKTYKPVKWSDLWLEHSITKRKETKEVAAMRMLSFSLGVIKMGRIKKAR